MAIVSATWAFSSSRSNRRSSRCVRAHSLTDIGEDIGCDRASSSSIPIQRDNHVVSHRNNTPSKLWVTEYCFFSVGSCMEHASPSREGKVISHIIYPAMRVNARRSDAQPWTWKTLTNSKLPVAGLAPYTPPVAQNSGPAGDGKMARARLIATCAVSVALICVCVVMQAMEIALYSQAVASNRRNNAESLQPGLLHKFSEREQGTFVVLNPNAPLPGSPQEGGESG